MSNCDIDAITESLVELTMIEENFQVSELQNRIIEIKSSIVNSNKLTKEK